MARTRDDALRWMSIGTELLLSTSASLVETDLQMRSSLPGWSRKHLLAHVAANADALCNLVHWAATGEEAPMYRSADERAAAITAGAKRPASDLLAWLGGSAERLAVNMSALTDAQWGATVVTAQGRRVEAAEIIWMRDREVMVHAVDLDLGVAFAELPLDFLEELRADITQKRRAAGEVLPNVSGPLAEVTAYLAGRRYAGVVLADGRRAQELNAWL